MGFGFFFFPPRGTKGRIDRSGKTNWHRSPSAHLHQFQGGSTWVEIVFFFIPPLCACPAQQPQEEQKGESVAQKKANKQTKNQNSSTVCLGRTTQQGTGKQPKLCFWALHISWLLSAGGSSTAAPEPRAAPSHCKSSFLRLPPPSPVLCNSPPFHPCQKVTNLFFFFIKKRENCSANKQTK